MHGYLIGTLILLHSIGVAKLGRPQVDALAAVPLLALAGHLLDGVVGLAMAQPSHGAGEPFLQRVARALRARRAGLDGAHGGLWLEAGH